MMKSRLVTLDPQAGAPWRFDAQTPGRRRALELARRVAVSHCPVLITGPTGVGKEVLAEDLHAHSPRAAGPFVSVNCAAIMQSLFESEFFGHARGAFTGAVGEKVGFVELADGGVLFLDEIGELSAEGQAKLLRFLAKGTFWPVGATRERSANVRVIAATHRELDGAQGASFREDLFYRLSVVVIRIPRLERGDICAIARAIASESMGRHRAPLRAPEVEWLARMCGLREWRGGVRELRNIIERFLVLYDPGLSLEENWSALFDQAEAEAPSGVRPCVPESNVAKDINDLIFLGIARECSDVQGLARRMGRTRQTIYAWLRKLKLRAEDVGATPALTRVMRQIQARAHPNVPWVQSVLAQGPWPSANAAAQDNGVSCSAP